MWDERVVRAITAIALDDLRPERWERDFADKLRSRRITVGMVQEAVTGGDAIVLYGYKGLRSIGLWNERWQLIAVWSPRHLSRWVTAFRHSEGRGYLLGLDEAELLWEGR